MLRDFCHRPTEKLVYLFETVSATLDAINQSRAFLQLYPVTKATSNISDVWQPLETENHTIILVHNYQLHTMTISTCNFSLQCSKWNHMLASANVIAWQSNTYIMYSLKRKTMAVSWHTKILKYKSKETAMNQTYIWLKTEKNLNIPHKTLRKL